MVFTWPCFLHPGTNVNKMITLTNLTNLVGIPFGSKRSLLNLAKISQRPKQPLTPVLFLAHDIHFTSDSYPTEGYLITWYLSINKLQQTLLRNIRDDLGWHRDCALQSHYLEPLQTSISRGRCPVRPQHIQYRDQRKLQELPDHPRRRFQQSRYKLAVPLNSDRSKGQGTLQQAWPLTPLTCVSRPSQTPSISAQQVIVR